jgi:hypothetical protein
MGLNITRLLTDALLSWFLHRHPDNFIVTANLSPLIGIVQKRMPTPTQTATKPTTGPLCLSPKTTDYETISS